MFPYYYSPHSRRKSSTMSLSLLVPKISLHTFRYSYSFRIYHSVMGLLLVAVVNRFFTVEFRDFCMFLSLASSLEGVQFNICACHYSSSRKVLLLYCYPQIQCVLGNIVAWQVLLIASAKSESAPKSESAAQLQWIYASHKPHARRSHKYLQPAPSTQYRSPNNSTTNRH